VTDALATQHLGHTALDLAALGLAVTTFVMAVIVAIALDRGAAQGATPHTTSTERTDP
jgi:hypothetical protein